MPGRLADYIHGHSPPCFIEYHCSVTFWEAQRAAIRSKCSDTIPRTMLSLLLMWGFSKLQTIWGGESSDIPLQCSLRLGIFK